MTSLQADNTVESSVKDKPKKKGGLSKIPKDPDANKWGVGFLVKLVLIGLVNAFTIMIVFNAYLKEAWGIMAAFAVLTIVVDWIYFSGRTLPLKYIMPGLAFLLIFQVYTIFYTVNVAFTNFGDGHNVVKGQAIEALLMQNERTVEGTAPLPLTIVESGGELGFAVIVDGVAKVGSADEPLTEVADATITDGRITEVPGWDVLTMQQVLADQTAVTSLRVWMSEDYADGSIRTQDGRNGLISRSVLTWDPDANTMTNVDTGVVYTADDSRGQFVSEDGRTLTVGWRVYVGFSNFTKAFTDSSLTGPFFNILWWTFAQALLSVLLTFLFGLFLAITFNKKIRGQKAYRTLMILPYAIPGFISALIFAGMFNRSYGFVNQVLLGGASIPWLLDPWLAKFAVLFVNLWLGFPYMFLISTGALQAIPEELSEAAMIDGASGWRQWWNIKFPLVLIATAPLLISSFAFNFNNFSLIYMLTGGGPSFGDPSSPLGHTDILISMVYKLSGISGGAPRDYGLASALSIIIFIIVGTISAISFRQTRKLEEMM